MPSRRSRATLDVTRTGLRAGRLQGRRLRGVVHPRGAERQLAAAHGGEDVGALRHARRRAGAGHSGSGSAPAPPRRSAAVETSRPRAASAAAPSLTRMTSALRRTWQRCCSIHWSMPKKPPAGDARHELVGRARLGEQALELGAADALADRGGEDDRAAAAHDVERRHHTLDRLVVGVVEREAAGGGDDDVGRAIEVGAHMSLDEPHPGGVRAARGRRRTRR